MEEIYDAGGVLDAVLTLPDERSASKAGRVYVDAFCQRRGIELFKTADLNDDRTVAWIKKQTLDWLLIIGWSQVARGPVLDAVKRGAIGMHPTLLPIGRGRAAIPWAILKGLSATGVSMFQLDEGVDTGPVIAQERVEIVPRETATTLYAKLEQAHRDLIRRTWTRLATSSLTATQQNESQATVWPGRTATDGQLSRSMTVEEADRLVRAVTRPYPGAFLDDGEVRLRIWSAMPAAIAPSHQGGSRMSFSDGELVLTEVSVESQ